MDACTGEVVTFEATVRFAVVLEERDRYHYLALAKDALEEAYDATAISLVVININFA